LSEGMHAKLNSRYVPRKPVLVYSDGPSLLGTTRGKALRTGFLEDAVSRTPNRLH
jgi:hypothetical protein